MRLLFSTLILARLALAQFGQGGGGLGDLLGGVLGGGGPGQGGGFGQGAGFGRGAQPGGFNLGEQLNNLMHNPNVQQVAGQIMQGANELINGISKSFFAPQPSENGVPPHVLRRAMRYCSHHPEAPQCQEHPELNVQGSLPDVGGRIDLGEVFPGLAQFHLPPVPRLTLVNVLQNVPKDLVAMLPPSLNNQITQTIKGTLLKLCANGVCKKQDPETLNLRATIAEREAALHRALSPGLDQNKIDQDIEVRMARTHQLKQAILRKAGLDAQIDPKDNGVFQNDILLTEDQANRLINQVNSNNPNEMAVPGAGGKRKRSAVFLEENFGRKWPTDRPIQYMFDPQLSATEHQQINMAIKEIQSKTCIRFQQVSARPAGNFIYYSKWTVGGFCGLSHIGMKSPAPNLIYLSFNCGNQPGVALHETLHALGLNHEQLRGDRDQFITIKWENVDPRQYDFFAMADAKEYTSYGVKYDYGSVMHYNQFINTARPGQPTMGANFNPAQNNPLMGQRNGMSQSDIALVKKMYCLPAKTFAPRRLGFRLTARSRVICAPEWANSTVCTSTPTGLQSNHRVSSIQLVSEAEFYRPMSQYIVFLV